MCLAGCDNHDIRPSHDLSNQWYLPDYLSEASGLAIRGNELLVHDDETAIVFAVDPNFPSVNRALQFDDPVMIEDLEGIAVQGSSIYLMNSEGVIFSADISQSKKGIAKNITTWETGLGEFCELEGLEAYDGLLLLPCKIPRNQMFEGQLTVFSFDPETGQSEEFFRIFMDEGSEDFALTGITYLGDDFYLLAARYLIIVNPVTSVSRIIPLSRDIHRQPEGIAVSADGPIYIVDDHRKGIGRLTKYDNLDQLISINSPRSPE